MFSEDFYPTPREIVELLLEPYIEVHKSRAYGDHIKQLKKFRILEPSAGKGDILDYIKEEYGDNSPYNQRFKLYAIEHDKELQHILRGKGYKVIDEDFLSYCGDYIFDLIIMNPPFSNGDQHLLHAWNTITEGDIVCLLNRQTLENANTSTRKLLLDIIQENGSVLDIGKAFSKASRRTNVDVVMVRLTKTSKAGALNFKFESLRDEKKYTINEHNINNPPALKDVIGNMLIQYDKVKDLFIQFIKLHAELRHYGDPLIAKVSGDLTKGDRLEPVIDIMSLAQKAISNGSNNQDAFNDFIDLMKDQMWGTIFQNLNQISNANIEALMTSAVHKNWSQYVSEQGTMDFTRENVWNMISMLFENKSTILEKCIVDVFDIFTRYYTENRNYIEGWKTNEKWKVNRKIILPNWIEMSWTRYADRMAYGAEYRLSHRHYREYEDIDKALCFISGKSMKSILTTYDVLKDSFKQQGKIYKGPHRAECESEFFRIKYFMKGTVHLEFKEKWMWEEFNMRACSQKMWLPENEEKHWRASKNKKQESSKSKQLMISTNDTLKQAS